MTWDLLMVPSSSTIISEHTRYLIITHRDPLMLFACWPNIWGSRFFVLKKSFIHVRDGDFHTPNKNS